MIPRRILTVTIVMIGFLLCRGGSLQAQTIPCILYTSNNDTLIGKAYYEGPIDLQNNGLVFVKRDKSETNYPPSHLKEAILFLSGFDTLRVLSMTKKVIGRFVENKMINETPDTHLLIKTDTENGVLSMHSIYTGIEIIYIPPAPGQFGGGGKKLKYLHTDFLILRRQLIYLPITQYERNEDLIKYLSDCPLLTDKLRKKKINPMKKMSKILSIYNHCKLQ